jgi:hypothetical protein
MGILGCPVNNARNRECGHRYHLRAGGGEGGVTSEWEACESDAYVKYEDDGGRRGAFSDSRKGENAKRNEE